MTGIRTVYRYHFDAERKALTLDGNWSLDYVGNTIQGYGWDPVIDEQNIWFMDNGEHTMITSMLNAGVNPAPNNVIRVSVEDASDFSITPVSSNSYGSRTNPPLYCARRRILVATTTGWAWTN